MGDVDRKFLGGSGIDDDRMVQFQRLLDELDATGSGTAKDQEMHECRAVIGVSVVMPMGNVSEYRVVCAEKDEPVADSEGSWRRRQD